MVGVALLSDTWQLCHCVDELAAAESGSGPNLDSFVPLRHSRSLKAWAGYGRYDFSQGVCVCGKAIGGNIIWD